MIDDESELFFQEVADVLPLKRERRVSLTPGGDERDSSLDARRQAAVTGTVPDRNLLSDRDAAPLDAWYVLEFKRPGVQNGVYRKLRQGRYEQEARLDLHRMTVAIARRELFAFVEQCHELGLRSVLLIHGKGERKVERERSAVLKGYVHVWLQEIPIVQAYHSAQPQHGGTGAVYVLLRKSEEQKRKNRERFTKGRVPVGR
ncbi:MAG: DNA endonuclease SmrA [Haliea sp.]|jgi:DNA-nicking Smr family endonuclease|nr:DNA endonuclease SmrA [Haliea sp.]MDP5063147.1 DNA endonuclease SmrA [Haliea sp.]